MGFRTRGLYWQALKDAGFTSDKPFREWTIDELRAVYASYQADGTEIAEIDDDEDDELPERTDEMDELREQLAAVTDTVNKLATIITSGQVEQPVAPPPSTTPALDPNEHAGVTLNTHAPDEVLEVDEYGNEWYQREVGKPGYAKPRGRRVLRYDDSGTKTTTVVGPDGYTETFEVSGDPNNSHPSEVKITLPSYQVGIYKAPNLPFRICTYKGARGFHWDDINAYFGGQSLVPAYIKRIYVSTTLCYDMQSVITTIEALYRERVLKQGTGA